jgi:hypothetical protein
MRFQLVRNYIYKGPARRLVVARGLRDTSQASLSAEAPETYLGIKMCFIAYYITLYQNYTIFVLFLC